MSSNENENENENEKIENQSNREIFKILQNIQQQNEEIKAQNNEMKSQNEAIAHLVKILFVEMVKSSNKEIDEKYNELIEYSKANDEAGFKKAQSELSEYIKEKNGVLQNDLLKVIGLDAKTISTMEKQAKLFDNVEEILKLAKENDINIPIMNDNICTAVKSANNAIEGTIETIQRENTIISMVTELQRRLDNMINTRNKNSLNSIRENIDKLLLTARDISKELNNQAIRRSSGMR